MLETQKIPYALGIDVGSTTVKTVLLTEEGEVLSSSYERHFSKVRETVCAKLAQLAQEHPLMIVTNADDGYVQAMFAAHDIGRYFIDFEMYGRTQLVKGENIRLVMQRNQIERAVYVGDTRKDQEACELAQVPFIYASYGFGEVDHWDARIDHFEELLTCIESF